MSHSTLFIAVLLTVFFAGALQHHCSHDKIDHDIKISNSSYSMYLGVEDRMLLTYENINILMDSSSLVGVTDDFKNYVLKSLIPPVTNYLDATLQVPVRSTNLKTGGFTTLCGNEIAVPSIYNTEGVDADLIIFINSKYDPNASYVAMASPCLLDPQTRRPVVGKVTFNRARMIPTTNDAIREKDIVTILHELTHVLGFSSGLYNYYMNTTTGQPLTGHLSTKSVFGLSTTILNLKPLTTRLRSHFNCSTLQGAYLENQGGSGSIGSHFERRIFYNEYMTASTLIDTRISEFTLALLEGSGWYQVNYDMAEPITWGKNKGCSFITGSCVDNTTKKANFPEFCTPLASAGCSWTKRAGSTCGTFSLRTQPTLPSTLDWFGNKTIVQDDFADNCPIRLPYANLDCEDPDNKGGATLAGETYGYGSKCFMGTLYPQGTLAQAYPYCFKSTCKEITKGSYYIEISVGTKKVNCTSTTPISVTGYSGKLNCPNPQEFCQQVTSEGFCRRKCSGRGTCIQKECACVEGWTGFDCSKPTSLHQCSRCANKDPLRTTCFGDQCVCDLTNTTCMCLLGLKTGIACDAIKTSTSTITNDMNSTTQTNTTTSTPTATTGTIIQKISIAPSEGTPSSDVHQNTQDHLNSSNSIFLYIVLGVMSSLGILLAIFFIRRYLKKWEADIISRAVSKTAELKNIENRPAKVQSDTSQNQQNSPDQNSPEFTHRRASRISSINHQDSPLISHNSPERARLYYSPSIFKNYSRYKMSPEGKTSVEHEEQGFTIQPMDLEKKVDVEDPKTIIPIFNEQIVLEEQLQAVAEQKKSKSTAS